MRRNYFSLLKAPRSIRTAAVIAALIIAFLSSRNNGVVKPGDRLERYYVRRVIDGDTIVLGNNERVRYIGINAPEVHHPKKGVEWLGPEAAEFNRKLVEHKWVTLAFDVELRDRYGRLLAYVYLDDLFVNAEMVKQGYARVYTFRPNVKHLELFTKLEREAQDSRKGIWMKGIDSSRKGRKALTLQY